MENYNLKNRTNNLSDFNFINWNEIPEIIESSKNYILTKQDRHVLGAIKLAYFVCEDGRKEIMKKSAITSSLVIAIIFVGLISLVSLSNSSTAVQSVNAATVSASIKSFGIEGSQGVGEFIESTMSAVRKSRTK